MFIINDITLQQIQKYAHCWELLDPVPCGFTGVAGQEVTPVFSNEVDAVSLIFGFQFQSAVAPSDASVWIRSTNPQYEWNVTANNGTPAFMPISAVMGNPSQVLPVLPLVMPFPLYPNGKIEFRLRNNSSGPITGGTIGIRRLKLTDPL